MGDMGDLFRDLREISKRRRAHNKEWSTRYLVTLGIEFKSFNNGEHLKIDRDIDFWTSTGRWRVGQTMSRGVKELIEYIKLTRGKDA